MMEDGEWKIASILNLDAQSSVRGIPSILGL
jgi:hypothetical protein